MNPLSVIRSRHIAVIAVALLAGTTGCQWMSSSKGSGDPDSDTTPEAVAKLKKENAQLKKQTDASRLELTRRDADLKNRDQLVKLLEEEVSSLKSDLDYVERQFVNFERRLTRKETKASAVSAIADVRILIEKMDAETDSGVDQETMLEVEHKLATASQLTEKRNYSAAVYYANRAMRILNRQERRISVREASQNAMVVSVTKANLRSGPGSTHDVILKLTYGTAVTQVAQRDEWVQVRTMNGQLGWMHKSLLH